MFINHQHVSKFTLQPDQSAFRSTILTLLSSNEWPSSASKIKGEVSL